MSARAAPAKAAGDAAESRAADYLAARGLRIVARNYRTRLGEIDLVAHDGDTLVFVEVRMRSSGAFGGALESITPAKRRRLEAAAAAYLGGLRNPPPSRFDVVALGPGEPVWLRAAFDGA